MEKWSINICEFFTSIQGEGKYVGRPAHFIRLSGCLMRCSFCDSKYAWGEGRKLSYSELCLVFDTFITTCPGILNLIITGGEPLEQDYLPIVERAVGEYCMDVEVETNGEPQNLKGKLESRLSPAVSYTVSPKKLDDRFFFVRFSEKRVSLFVEYGATFKFVIRSEDDLEVVEEFIRRYAICPDTVYLQPVNNDIILAQLIMHFILNYIGCRLSLQIHKILDIK